MAVPMEWYLKFSGGFACVTGLASVRPYPGAKMKKKNEKNVKQNDEVQKSKSRHILLYCHPPNWGLPVSTYETV